MHEKLLNLLRCPVSRSPLTLEIIKKTTKTFRTGEEEIISEGILFAREDWFYPVIGGIPRLGVESFIDQAGFLSRHLPDYAQRRARLETRHAGLLRYILEKNRKTKESFSYEWSLYNYTEDRTWEAGGEALLMRFLEETAETGESIKGKLIFDAGCGNGHLNQFIAAAGATVIGLDFSNSIERAFQENKQREAIFIQGDVQFPPLAYSRFDIVHSSGVLTHTNNTELSFCCIEPCVKPGGKLSTWLYGPREDRIHHLFNAIRRMLVPLPLKLNYFILLTVFYPASYLIKRLKGNRQNKREMIIALLDQFTPEFRWEHTPDEVAAWFSRRGYEGIRVTTTGTFGFNMIGIRPKETI
jgi:2-polyprenyl-3-methyl-5-hydroxy-6-metoxy-1,4-benzoquinol methylase